LGELFSLAFDVLSDHGGEKGETVWVEAGRDFRFYSKVGTDPLSNRNRRCLRDTRQTTMSLSLELNVRKGLPNCRGIRPGRLVTSLTERNRREKARGNESSSEARAGTAPYGGEDDGPTTALESHKRISPGLGERVQRIE
jgi:hypothetical protein